MIFTWRRKAPSCVKASDPGPIVGRKTSKAPSFVMSCGCTVPAKKPSFGLSQRLIRATNLGDCPDGNGVDLVKVIIDPVDFCPSGIVKEGPELPSVTLITGASVTTAVKV